MHVLDEVDAVNGVICSIDLGLTGVDVTSLPIEPNFVDFFWIIEEMYSLLSTSSSAACTSTAHSAAKVEDISVVEDGTSVELKDISSSCSMLI